jgi:HPt (histidine-containing phosphotransfer) domain-containing protein
MDDHIGKPINIEEFYEVLLKQLGVVLKKEKNVNEKLKTGILDKEIAIKNLANNEVLWKKISTKFYNKYDTMNEQIENMVKENSFDDLLNYIHTLKGLSGTIGATLLAEEAYKVEKGLKDNGAVDGIDFNSFFEKKKELFELLKASV